jgi:hypothetical protein
MANSGKGNLSETENSSIFDIRNPTLLKKLAIVVCVVLLGAGIIWLVSWIINEVDRDSSVSGGGGANTSGGVHASTSSSTPPPPNTGAPPPPPNTGAAETPPTPASAPALIDGALNSQLDPGLCNSNSGVFNITEMPCSNDFTQFVSHWKSRIEQCNSGSTQCQGLTYSKLYDNYLTSGTPGSCSENSPARVAIQNASTMCDSVEQDDSCLITDANKADCCPFVFTGGQPDEDNDCFSNSPGCTINNLNNIVNMETCNRWIEEQRTQNPPPTTPDEEANPSDSQCNIYNAQDAIQAISDLNGQVANCPFSQVLGDEFPPLNPNIPCPSSCLTAMQGIINCSNTFENLIPNWNNIPANFNEVLEENITLCGGITPQQ